MKEFFIVMTLIGFAVFLILLVLVQRGRGGGLAGALGGAGGQSAFGAKAGDTFTKITMWTAFFWIVFCIVAVRLMSGSGEPDFSPIFGDPGVNNTGSAAAPAEGSSEAGPAAAADGPAATPAVSDSETGGAPSDQGPQEKE
jgi:preprotein translocase subunit SecG